MRTLVLTIVLTAIGASPAAAQHGRLSFELSGGHSTTSPIFEHEVITPAGTLPGVTDQTRLSLGQGTAFTGRIAYRLAGPWIVVGALGKGSTEYHYRQSVVATTGTLSTRDQWGRASRTLFSLGVAHQSMLAALPLFIEPELAFAVQRLRVGDPATACVPGPPSMGVITACVASERWERTYSVPSVGLGLSLGYVIVPRVAVQVRGHYAVGRTSTKEAFYEDLVPQYDFAEAPTSQTIRSSHVSVGLRIAP